jgi:hypothetical protein
MRVASEASARAQVSCLAQDWLMGDNQVIWRIQLFLCEMNVGYASYLNF